MATAGAAAPSRFAAGHRRLTRRAALVLCAGGMAASVGGCGPAGAVGDIIGRDQKDAHRRDLAEKIRQRWLARDAERFGDLRASVSYSNDWQNLFAAQYTLIVTGTVRDEWDREMAVLLAREVLGVEGHRVYVTNTARVVSQK